MAKRELAIHLRIYKGKTLSFDANGNSANENHIVTLIHDTAEYKKFLAYMLANGIIKAEVEKVFDLNSFNSEKEKSDPDYYSSIDDFSDIQKEFDEALKTETDKVLSPQEKRIAELEAKLESLINGVPETEPTEPKTQASEELKEARKQYKELYGTKGSPLWTIEEINAKIEEFKPATEPAK